MLGTRLESGDWNSQFFTPLIYICKVVLRQLCTLIFNSTLRLYFSKKLQDSLTAGYFSLSLSGLTARGGLIDIASPSGLTAVLNTHYFVATAVSDLFLGLRLPGFGNAGSHRV